MTEKTPEELKAEIRILKDQLEGVEDVLRALAGSLGAGGYNAIEVHPEVFLEKINWGIDNLVNVQAKMADKREKRLKDQLEASNRKLEKARSEVERVNAVAHRRKSELDAAHWVWCSGGCFSGVKYYPTEDTVRLAEQNTKRLRSWFENYQARERERIRRTEEKDGGL